MRRSTYVATVIAEHEARERSALDSIVLEPVLFVDDDPDLRELVEITLGRIGIHHVVTADSLRQVEEKREQVLACRLAILDINLGAGQPSGVQVHQWLGHEHFAGKIVFLTGHAANDPQVQQAASLAGSQIAAKPLSLSELARLVEAPSR